MTQNINFPFKLPLILDGATGTELNKRGMQSTDCTEKFILQNPKVLQKLQVEYISAGSDAVLAPTFGANRPTMERHGFAGDTLPEICEKLVNITKQTATGKLVGGDMSPTGLLLKPYGEAEPTEIFEIYREQAKALLDNKVDFILIETMLSAAEARLALMAVRSLSKEIPVFVTLTVNESGRTMNGDSMGATLMCMIPFGITAFGCNCSIGPEIVANALKSASPVAKKYGIPLIAKPNAGMPQSNENGTFFPLTPADMADWVDNLAGLGVGIFGGCCGTTPEHIKAISQKAREEKVKMFETAPNLEEGVYVATSREYKLVDNDAEFIKITPDSEEDIYDLLDECELDDVLYFELESGSADLIIRMDAFLPNPICLKGNTAEIEKIEKTLCRKVR